MTVVSTCTAFRPDASYITFFSPYKGSPHKHTVFICSSLVFLILTSNNMQSLNLGGWREQLTIPMSFNKLYRLYFLIDFTLVYFLGVVFFIISF